MSEDVEARTLLETALKALAPFERIWAAIEHVQEMDRDARLRRWLHIEGPGASGGSFLEETEVLAGYRAYHAIRINLSATPPAPERTDGE